MTHATHLIVLCTVFKDQAHVGHKVPGGLVVLRAPQLQPPLHHFQVHRMLDDLVVVWHLVEKKRGVSNVACSLSV